jgi:hypothetical protein
MDCHVLPVMTVLLTSTLFFPHPQGNNAEEPTGVTSEGNSPTLFTHPSPGSGLPAHPSALLLEFDKFLEERAKAADRLPNLASPSAEGPPGLPSATAPRRKTQEKDDDMLFTL